MHLMYCDETNLEELEHIQFFIYGGLILHADAAEPLCDRVDAIRRDHGFGPEDSLKFQAASRPSHVDRDDWNTAKGAVVDACGDADARFIAVLVHHRIAANEREHLVEWQLNTLLYAYNQYLWRQDDAGLVTMDRLPNGNEYQLMSERFRIGSKRPSGSRVQYPKIIGYSSACDGTSHLMSAADVVLGTFAYCVNERREGIDRPVELMQKVRPLVWAHPRLSVFDRGVILNPADTFAYRREYREFKEHMLSLGLDHHLKAHEGA